MPKDEPPLIDISDMIDSLYSEEAVGARAARRRAVRKARARKGWDKKPAQRNRRIAAIHRPEKTLAESIRVFVKGRPVKISGLVAQPEAVHATRRFDALLNEIARLIELGEIAPDEVSFVCSEFFYFGSDHHGWFVLQPGQPPIPANTWSVDYVAKAITFKSAKEGALHSVTISPPRFAVIASYLDP